MRRPRNDPATAPPRCAPDHARAAGVAAVSSERRSTRRGSRKQQLRLLKPAGRFRYHTLRTLFSVYQRQLFLKNQKKSLPQQEALS